MICKKRLRAGSQTCDEEDEEESEEEDEERGKKQKEEKQVEGEEKMQHFSNPIHERLKFQSANLRRSQIQLVWENSLTGSNCD